jgi:hypothetical protein
MNKLMTGLAVLSLCTAGCLAPPDDVDGDDIGQLEQASINYSPAGSDIWGVQLTMGPPADALTSLDKYHCVQPGQVHRVAWEYKGPGGGWMSAYLRATYGDGRCLGMRGAACKWDDVANYSLHTVIHDACCWVHGRQGSFITDSMCGHVFGPINGYEGCDHYGGMYIGGGSYTPGPNGY